MASYSTSEQRILNSFGDKLKQSRLKNGLSQEKLAEVAELHRTYIGSAERGERNVSLLNLTKIAHALNVAVYALLPDEEK